MSRIRTRLRSEEGYSFPELIIASVVLLIAATAAMALMLRGFNQNTNQSDRVVALDEARNGLLRMTQEIRSAAALDSVHPQILDVLVHFPEDTSNPYHWIRYKCVGNDQGGSQGLGGTCSRQDKDLNSASDCADDGAGPGCTIILRRVTKEQTDAFAEPCDNIDPASNEEKHFCVRDNRTVQLSFFVHVPGAENPIELRDAVTVRNCLDNQEEVVPCVDSTPSS